MLKKIFLISIIFFSLTAGLTFSEEITSYCPARQSYLYYLKGVLLEREGKISEALEMYKKSLQFDPESRYLQQELGRLYFRLGEIDSALETLEKLVKENEKDTKTLLILAQVYLVRGEEKKAVSCYTKILALEPENPDALLNQANLLSKEEPKQAMEFYERYLALEPLNYHNADIYLKLANLAEKVGEKEKALTLYQKIIEGFAQHRGSEFVLLAHLNRASIYEKEGEKEKSLKEYESAMTLEPENTTLRLKLGTLYYTLKDYTQAKKLFVGIAEKEPKNLEANYYLFVIALEEKKWEEAIVHAKKVAQLKKDDPRIYFQMGYLYGLSRDLKKALKALKKAIELDPNNPDNFYLLGLTYQDANKYEKAEKSYIRALELKPDNPDILLQLASLYDRKKEIEKALELFKKIISLQAKNALALNYVGYTYAEQGVNLEEAENLIRQALETDPKNGAYIDSLGWVYFQKKDYEKARILLEEASQVLEDPVILDHLGETYQLTGRLPEAKNTWEKALKLDPKNKTLRNKLKEINQHLLPGSRIRKLLKQQEGNQKQITSLKIMAQLTISNPEGTFFFPVILHYRAPRTMRIDLLGTFALPQTIIIVDNESFRILPKLPLPTEVISDTETFTAVRILQNWLNGELFSFLDNPRMKVRKDWFHYHLSDTNLQAEMEKKNGFLRSCYLEGINLNFRSYVLTEGLWIPQKIRITFLAKNLSLFLELGHPVFNQELKENTFSLP